MACLGWGLGCGAPEPEPEGRPLAERGDDYVTSDACQSCHPGEHASWSASYHRRMAQLPTREAMRVSFDGTRVDLGTRRYTLGQSEDAFWVVDQAGYRRDVVLTTGFHHFQAYWYASGKGRELSLFPFMYKISEARWMPFNALVLTPPGYPQNDSGGEWNRICVACHSVHGRPGVVGEAPADTRVAEFGIACEACHGPGEEHVRANRDPIRRMKLRLGDDPDDTIVNPARLDPLRSAQVCGQCHAVQSLGDWSTWLAEGAPYKPGGDLFATRVQRHGDDPLGHAVRFWPDGRVRVGGREYPGITESACFASGDLDCTTCHQLHQSPGDARTSVEWADDQLAAGMRGDTACIGCHPSLAGDPARAAHTHHATDSPGSQCMSCHMPKNAFGLHKATRSHFIASPTARESVELGRPNACNLCHLDRTLAWTAGWLETWYGEAPPALEGDDAAVAAGIAWVLKGDANQRALAGWHMGDPAAQRASGTDWMAPHLAQLLRDGYEANRAVARASLRTLPGFAELEVDYIAGWPKAVDERALAIQRIWMDRDQERAGAPRPELLLHADGSLDVEAAADLMSRRDNRPIYLAE